MVDIPVRQEKSAPSRPRLARSPPTVKSRIVSREEIAKNDFNISPSRYIHIGEADEYRPIAEIVEELETLEGESAEIDTALKVILKCLIR